MVSDVVASMVNAVVTSAADVDDSEATQSEADGPEQRHAQQAPGGVACVLAGNDAAQGLSVDRSVDPTGRGRPMCAGRRDRPTKTCPFSLDPLPQQFRDMNMRGNHVPGGTSSVSHVHLRASIAYATCVCMPVQMPSTGRVSANRVWTSGVRFAPLATDSRGGRTLSER
jgi:hypothetical protein